MADINAAPAAQDPPLDPAEQAVREAMIGLFRRLGFNQQAAEYLFDTQDINSVQVLMTMDDDEIELLCKVCRSPGGTIQPPARNGRLPARISNPGVQIALRHENNLKLAVFYLKYQKMTSRPIDIEHITGDSVQAIKSFKMEILSREDPESKEAPTLTNSTQFEFFEAFRDYLNKHTGSVSKRPLGYVVRKDFQVKASNEDIPYGEPGTAYHDRYLEIEMRAPIKRAVIGPDGGSFVYDEHFRHDNSTVWNLLTQVLKDTGKKNYIASFKDKKDGREAILHLHTQLLGADAISAAASKAENALSDTYLEPNKKFGLEQYISRHMEQHVILTKLKAYGHVGIDDTSKVRHFLRGIRDPAYKTCSATCAVRSGSITFEEVVARFRTFKELTNSTSSGRRGQRLNVSPVGTSTGTGNNQRSGKRGPTPESDGYDPNKNYDSFAVADMYYKGAAWSNLKKGERNYLRKKRADKKKRKSDTISKDDSKMKRTITKQKAKIASLAAQLKEATVSSDSDSDASSVDVKRMKMSKSSTKIQRKKE